MGGTRRTADSGWVSGWFERGDPRKTKGARARNGAAGDEPPERSTPPARSQLLRSLVVENILEVDGGLV